MGAVRSISPAPFISVITVCYNSAEFIEDCIKSVLAQGYRNFEHVIIDGGSTDATVGIIHRYKRYLAYWHSEPDRGLAHAFNLGVEHSSGQWLVFLNSDDFFLGDSVLGEIASYLGQNPDADVVFGQVILVSRERKPKCVGGPYGRTFSWRKFTTQCTIPHQAAFTNRRYFDRVGLFSEDFRITVDYEHYLRATPRLKAIFVPVVVAYMRDGGLCKRDLPASLRELAKAQLETGVWPPLVVKCLCTYFIFRSFLGGRWRALWGRSE